MDKLRIKLFQPSTKSKLKLKLTLQNHNDFELVSEPPDILTTTDRIIIRKY